jgi:hypothetical protein
MTAIIVAATFASILALAPAVNGSTEQPITIQGMSGTVEISTNGIEWTPLVPSDTISLGDTVRTGTNSVLLIQFSGGKIVLGQNTNVTYTDPHGLHHILLLLLGIIWADLQSATGGSDSYEADLGSNVAVGVRGTEFTATVYENGTANVMVIEGSVEVQDLTSNSTVLLQANQMITVLGGLSQQDMSQAVETVNPNSTVAWWEESPIGPIATLTPSSTLSTTTLAVYVVGAVVVVVVVAGALVLYIRRRKVKH